MAADGTEDPITATEMGERFPGRSRVRAFLRFALCAGIIGVLCWSTDFSEVLATLSGTRPGLLLAAFAVVFLDRLLMAYKWNLLLRCQRVEISLPTAVKVLYQGHLLGVLTPGGLGGDAYRIYALRKAGPTLVIAASLVIERLIGVAVIGTTCLITLPFSARYIAPEWAPATYVMPGIGLLALVVILLSLQAGTVRRLGRLVPGLRANRLAGKISEFYGAYAQYQSHTSTLILFTLLTFLELFLLVLLSFLATLAVGIGVSLAYYLCVIPLLHGLARLPLTFQGLGIMDALFVYFVMEAGYTKEGGLSVALLHRALEVVGLLLPSAVLLLVSRPLAKPTDQQPAGEPRAEP